MCQGAWAKYPKKQLDGADGQIWGTFNPLGAPRLQLWGWNLFHLPIATVPQRGAKPDMGDSALLARALRGSDRFFPSQDRNSGR